MMSILRASPVDMAKTGRWRTSRAPNASSSRPASPLVMAASSLPATGPKQLRRMGPPVARVASVVADSPRRSHLWRRHGSRPEIGVLW